MKKEEHAMKQLYALLKIALGADIGVFVGSSLYRVWEYRTYPQWYAMQSAPWYLSIEINAVFAAVLACVLLSAIYLVGRKLGKPAGFFRTLSLISLAIALCACLWTGFELFGYHTDCDTVRRLSAVIGVFLVLSLVCPVLERFRKKIKR